MIESTIRAIGVYILRDLRSFTCIERIRRKEKKRLETILRDICLAHTYMLK